MRLDLKTITQIHSNLLDEGIDNVQIGYTEFESSFTLRFGYWEKIKPWIVDMVNGILTDKHYISEQLVDDDPECGELWTYIILKK